MSRGVNKAIIIGNLGNDPDIRYTQSGACIANISVATSEQWTDKESGEKQERVEWHRIVFFGRLAEIVAEYLKKGSQVYVEGRLQTRKWEDKEGVTRYSTEIVAGQMQMLGGRGDGGKGGDERAENQERSYTRPDTPRAPDPGEAQEDFKDDDIPF